VNFPPLAAKTQYLFMTKNKYIHKLYNVGVLGAIIFLEVDVAHYMPSDKANANYKSA